MAGDYALLALVLKNHGLGQVLPLGLLDILKRVRVSHGEVLAEHLNVVNGLFKVVVNVLLDCQDGLVLVRKLEFLGKFNHPEEMVIVREWQKLKLEVNLSCLLRSGVWIR